MHEPCLSQVTSHAAPPHFTLPAHALSPLQLTTQLAAWPQSTPLGQALVATHATSQGTPAGQVTLSLQGWSASHVITQVLPSHSPTPAQALAQSSGEMRGALPPPPPVPLPRPPPAAAA